VRNYSVIVPVYNGAEYLRRCLDSIIASIGADDRWEIVCVDDFSTDATAEILADYASRDPRFVLAKHPVNRGLGEARNTGLARASGQWIAWVDADDAVLPEWASVILRETAANDAGVLCYGARMWKDGVWRPMRYDRKPRRVSAACFLRDVVRDIGSSTWMWNKVFRIELFDGVTFTGRCQEDFNLMPALLSRAGKVRTVPDLLYEYFRPSGSLSRHGDLSGSAKGIVWALEGPKTSPALLPRGFKAVWLEGCALRAADFLRHAGPHSELRSFLRRNVWRVLCDPAQSLRVKVKCLLACW